MKIQTTLLLAGAVALGTSARAQVPDAVQQMDNTQSQQQAGQIAKSSYAPGDSVAESYAGEVSDVGEQTVIRLKPRATHFEFSADVQYLHTDNMFDSDAKQQEADELISTVSFALAPSAYPLEGGDFAPRVGYEQQWYNFGLMGRTTDGFIPTKLNNYDFTAEMPFLDLAWTKNHWTYDAGFNFTRLISGPDGGEFYREYTPHWGVQRLFQINDGASVAVGYEGDFRFGVLNNPAALTVASDYNNRTDQGLFATYTQRLCTHAVLQPFYRFNYTHFLSGGVDRDDYFNSVGAALYWVFTPQISARLFVSFEARNTSAPNASDYRRLDDGVGLNLTFRF
jgi:hypothetical protein